MIFQFLSLLKKKHSQTGILVVLIAWFFFSLMSAGNLGLDSRNRFEITQNVLSGQGPVSPEYGTIVIERDGESVRYSRYHLGQSILLIPPYLFIGLPLKIILPESLAERGTEFVFSSLVFPFFSALGMGLLYLLLLQLGAENKKSVLTVLAVCFCTPFLWYGSSPHETSQIFLLMTLAAVLATQSSPSNFRLLLAGLIITLPTWFKPLMALDMGLILVGLSLYLVRDKPTLPKQSILMLWSGYGVGGIASVALFLWDNANRFGGPLKAGYSVWFEQHGLEPFSLPIWKGLFGIMLSLDFGILWLCPVLFWVIAKAIKSDLAFKPLYLLTLAAFIFSVLIHSPYISYAGSFAVGPRFQMHLLPFLLMPLAFVEWRKMLVPLLIIGAVVSFSAKALSPGLEFAVTEQRFKSVTFAEEAPFKVPGVYGNRALNLAAKVSGTLEEKALEQNGGELNSYQQSLLVWDFYWVRGQEQGGTVGKLLALCGVIQTIFLIGLLKILISQIQSKRASQADSP